MKKLLVFLLVILSVCAFAQGKMDWSDLYGKKAAVFGGSFSCIKESEAAKNVWRDKLNMTVVTYGVGGMGFSKETGKDNIQAQVDKAVQTEIYDIYILWASTNDFGQGREIGDYLDYTKKDNFDETKLSTQSGGINYCVKKIYEANPNARIYFFTTLQNDRWGDTSDDPFYAGSEKKIADYVAGQVKSCKYWGIPCFNMFDSTPINEYTKSLYVQSDGLHLTEACYARMGETMAMFMVNH